MVSRWLALASTALVLVPSVGKMHATAARRPTHVAIIRTVPVGPASTSAAVWPAFAVDGQGAVYFFGGSCGAKPVSCWCEVLRQRPGERVPTIIAGHVPGSNLQRSTPAQRVPLGGCTSIAVDQRGIVELFAMDLTHNRAGWGTPAIFRIDPRSGGYREQKSCVRCQDGRISGPLSKVSLYGASSAIFHAAFDAAGNVYLANDEHHVIQKVSPNGMVSVVMRPHCRSRYENGPLVEIRDCVECSNSSVAQNNDVFQCPEWPAIGPRGGFYYVDDDDNTVRVIDRRGHERVVVGGGTCRIWRLSRCGSSVPATRLWLRDASTNGPRSLALDANGSLYITLWSYLLQITPSGTVHVLAGNGQLPLSARGRVYPPGVPATRVPITARAVTVDPQGHVYFLDDTGAVRELVSLPPSGSVSLMRTTPSRVANLISVHMASPVAGWAVGTMELLRTTDGGAHWQGVTPPALGSPLRQSPYGLVTAFLNATRAWVAVDNSVTSAVIGQSKPPTALRLFRTPDGGHHWQSLPLLHLGTFYYASKLSFVSRRAGWLEIIRNVGAGSAWLDLYRTLDGGVHWRRTLQVGSPHPSPEAPLGCDLCDSALAFSSQTTAWFTGCWCGIGNGSGRFSSFLYVSRNAGRTWRPVSLPAPPRIPLGTIATLAPTLFDRHEGTLPTVVYQRIARPGRERAFFDVYVTRDDGRHWTPTTPVPIHYPQAGPQILHSFPDARHGFFLVAKRLYRTTGGGRHWQAIPLQVPLDRSATIQFLDARHGFALRPGDVGGRRSILWQTTDGGEIWKPVSATIVNSGDGGHNDGIVDGAAIGVEGTFLPDHPVLPRLTEPDAEGDILVRSSYPMSEQISPASAQIERLDAVAGAADPGKDVVGEAGRGGTMDSDSALRAASEVHQDNAVVPVGEREMLNPRLPLAVSGKLIRHLVPIEMDLMEAELSGAAVSRHDRPRVRCGAAVPAQWHTHPGENRSREGREGDLSADVCHT